MKGQHPRITLPTQPLCRSCGEPVGNINYGNGRTPAFCQRNACYAAGIRAYWKKWGFVAEVKYVEGNPVLVGVPGKM